MNVRLLIFGMLIPFLLFTSATITHSEEVNEFDEFQMWADQHGINLVGVTKNSIELYYHGFHPETDYVDWREVPRVLVAANELYKIPENVIQVMTGKTIYFSTEYGRGYTILASFPDHEILVGLDRGIIIEQNINSYTIIHELGHIVDYHGIRGYYKDSQNIFGYASEDRSSIFQVNVEYQPKMANPPDGYITVYATANDAENFAENFAQYIQYPNAFRERIHVDPLLAEEYDFLRDEIFQGIEFG